MSSILIQWPSAPRGASVKPTPCVAFGQLSGDHLAMFAVDVSPALIIGDELAELPLQFPRRPLAFKTARRRASQRREQRRHRHIELAKRGFRRLLELRNVLRVADEETGERPDLHRIALPARRLDPAVFRALIDLLDMGAAALGVRAELIVRFGHAVIRVKALRFVGIFVPAMRDEFLDFVWRGEIDILHLGEIAVDDRAARQQQAAGRIIVRLVGDIAIGEHRL